MSAVGRQIEIKSRAHAKLSELSFKSAILPEDAELFENPVSSAMKGGTSSSAAASDVHADITAKFNSSNSSAGLHVGESGMHSLDGGDSMIYQNNSVEELTVGLTGALNSRIDYQCPFDEINNVPGQKTIQDRRILSVLSPSKKFSKKSLLLSENDDNNNNKEETLDDLRKLPKVLNVKEKVIIKKKIIKELEAKEITNHNANNANWSTWGVAEQEEYVEEEIIVVKEKHIWETLDDKQRALMFSGK